MVLARSNFDEIFNLAESQQGCFSFDQAHDLGITLPELREYVNQGKIIMIMRGIYRIRNFPSLLRDQEDLVVAWLWSNQKGIISHESALQRHGLSDVLPSRNHITMPTSLGHLQKKKPLGLSVHYANVAEFEVQWIGPVPVTVVSRTINDIAMDHGDAVQLEKAINQAIKKDLISVVDVYLAVDYIAGNV